MLLDRITTRWPVPAKIPSPYYRPEPALKHLLRKRTHHRTRQNSSPTVRSAGSLHPAGPAQKTARSGSAEWDIAALLLTQRRGRAERTVIGRSGHFKQAQNDSCPHNARRQPQRGSRRIARALRNARIRVR